MKCKKKKKKQTTSTFCSTDGALEALHNARAISVIMSIPDTFVDAEIGMYNTEFLKRFRDLGYDLSSLIISSQAIDFWGLCFW